MPPAAELQAHAVRLADLKSGNITRAWRDWMRFQIDRARQFYAEARPGIRLPDPDGQFTIPAASDLYRGILAVIEQNDYDVFSHDASVGALGKTMRLPALFLKLRFGL